MSHSSPLHRDHVAAGAKLTDFAGWQMPLTYPAGTVAEHRSVREAVGLFDVSHLGKVVVEGPGAEGALDRLLPGKIARLGAGRAGYNLVLTEQGGIIDDIFVYRRQDDFLLVPNASNTDAVIDYLKARTGGAVQIVDARRRWAIIALSGPRAREVILPVAPQLESLRMHDFADVAIAGKQVLAARTGYTGEVTFEFFVDWDEAGEFWRFLLDAGAAHGIAPAGLGARDTLRLEMGYPLHGHELSTDITPLEAGLGWVLEWDKEFAGKQALEQLRAQGVARRLAGLRARAGGRIPRSGHQVSLDGKPVGMVTSGNFSPTLAAGIALAFVPPELSKPGTRLCIGIRGKPLPVEVVKLPFKTS